MSSIRGKSSSGSGQAVPNGRRSVPGSCNVTWCHGIRESTRSVMVHQRKKPAGHGSRASRRVDLLVGWPFQAVVFRDGLERPSYVRIAQVLSLRSPTPVGCRPAAAVPGAEPVVRPSPASPHGRSSKGPVARSAPTRTPGSRSARKDSARKHAARKHTAPNRAALKRNVRRRRAKRTHTAPAGVNRSRSGQRARPGRNCGSRPAAAPFGCRLAGAPCRRRRRGRAWGLRARRRNRRSGYTRRR